MWGTVLYDSYGSTDVEEMAAAIEDLCSPNDREFFSATGVYAYWNPTNLGLLYIGLARDLPKRFRDHNLGPVGRGTGNKSAEIDEFLRDKPKIGLSLVPLSPLTQQTGQRSRSVLEPWRWQESEPEISAQADLEVRSLEGRLIETHRRTTGARPKWNKMGGKPPLVDHLEDDSLAVLTGKRESVLRARASIRELSNCPEFAYNESWLHGARGLALNLSGPNGLGAADWQRALEKQQELTGDDRLARMRDSGYLPEDGDS